MWAHLALTVFILLSASLVVSSFNPVFGVIWLVLTFIGGCLMFWNLGAQFLALILIIVYVGAIAVMFLFVIMMLPTSLRPYSLDLSKLVPIALIITILLIVGGISTNWFLTLLTPIWNWSLTNRVDIQGIFLSLYQDDPIVLLLAGVVLLIALIGALILCTSSNSKTPSLSKKQNSFLQISR
uniref:NADH-ubiquinone oxidoreductase chain 6 n=1 Tax=Carybdea xaymacana TaxID=168719 RepID=G9IT66_9CNID|nr:NADH dehydrogenase subunit 6 [Carybdea xaymacana]